MNSEGFRRSSFCSGGNCVEVAPVENERVHVRDQDGRTVSYSYEEWRAFLRGAKAGEFDV